MRGDMGVLCAVGVTREAEVVSLAYYGGSGSDSRIGRGGEMLRRPLQLWCNACDACLS